MVFRFLEVGPRRDQRALVRAQVVGHSRGLLAHTYLPTCALNMSCAAGKGRSGLSERAATSIGHPPQVRCRRLSMLPMLGC
jgi:hypothetical protein